MILNMWKDFNNYIYIKLFIIIIFKTWFKKYSISIYEKSKLIPVKREIS